MNSNKLSFKSLYSASQISQDDVKMIFDLAVQYKQTLKSGQKIEKTLEDKIIATLFFEPSTRTRLSFESAAIRLGAKVINAQGKDSSSLAKGESIAHTAKVMSNYCDLAVFRHSVIGSAEEFAKHSKVPLINAGDGANEHPTQALLDAFTIYENFNRLSDLKILFHGDIKNSRTIPSLIKLLSKFGANEFCLVSSANYQITEEKLEELKRLNPANNLKTTTLKDINFLLQFKTDICYFTRIQLERKDQLQDEINKDIENIKNTLNLKSSEQMSGLLEKIKTKQVKQHVMSKLHDDFQKDFYNLSKNQNELFIKLALQTNPQAILMHPLPIVDEIPSEFDTHPQAKYFEQAENGLYVRMALLNLMF
jgi:aspartate carbamoyltransferase catalytic subunit